MRTQPMILGYFILPHDGSEGYASLSLEDLLKSNGSELKFPFLNSDRLQQLKCHPGVHKRNIHAIDSTGFKEKIGWSPASRFLYQMSENGMSDKLGIPSNRLIITSRKTIIEIIKFGRPNNANELSLKTKLKIQNKWKVIKMAYVNQAQRDNFWNRKQSNSLFGLKFGLYLTNDDKKSTKTDATLFSIHCLQIDNVCFIYEAEIDAIQLTNNDKSEETSISIFEIKTHNNNKEEILKAFKKYAECSNMKNSSQLKIERSINKLEDMFVSLKSGLPFCQGELGNVHKFIYGFYDKHNQHDQSFISAEEFDCYPGTFLSRDASYVLDFVELLNDSGIFSPNYGLTWDNWDSWKLRNEGNFVTLEKDGKIIGNLTKWEKA